MADIALLAPGVAAAPEGYQIPGAQEIIVKAVTATYDGTDAAGDFVPTLQVIAPNGTILASCPTSTALVAGASADVSWFPRSGVSSGGGGSGITGIESVDGSVTVTDPTGPITDLSVNFPPPPVVNASSQMVTGGLVAGAGSQNDVSWSGGGSILDLTTPTNPTLIATGAYLIGVQMAVNIGGSATTQFIRWGLFVGTPISGTIVAGTTAPLAANKPSQSNVFYGLGFAANSAIGVQVNNDDSQAHTLSFTMTVVLLS